MVVCLAARAQAATAPIAQWFEAESFSDTHGVAVSAGSGIHLFGHDNTVDNCRIHDCNYVGTYDAGVNFNKRNVDDPNEGPGNRIVHSTIYNCGRGTLPHRRRSSRNRSGSM